MPRHISPISPHTSRLHLPCISPISPCISPVPPQVRQYAERKREQEADRAAREDLLAQLLPELEARYRGGIGEIQGRYRGDIGEIQGRYLLLAQWVAPLLHRGSGQD